jgi:SAM-dependent methyltransferase
VTTIPLLSSAAEEAYDAIAPAYDALTAGYPHERWLAELEALAAAHGLRGRRLLDIACGTGSSFLPMLDRGYSVTGCDIAQGMLDRARAKAPHVVLQRADMRALPSLGSFDLITCLDDALNYLLTEQELLDALAGIERNLAPGGIAIWDLNTLAQYRGQFARDQILDRPDVFIGWSAQCDSAIQAGDLVDVAIDVFAPTGDDAWRRTTSRHRQRHWPSAAVEHLAALAGLEVIDVRGQRPGAVIDVDLDELVHIKAIYLAAKTNRR